VRYRKSSFAFSAVSVFGFAAGVVLAQGPAPSPVHHIEPNAAPRIIRGQPLGLQVENLTNPIGVDVAAPRLSWKIDAAMQVAYEVRAATTTDHLESPDLWDTGKIISAASNNVPYAGLILNSRQRVQWQVRVWTDRDPAAPSAWSAPAFWEMGLLNAGDWSARWIAYPNYVSSEALPVFQQSFAVAGPVQAARLYIVGLGMYEIKINGQPATDDVLTPGDTLQHVRLEYATLDVTGLLAQGGNTITVALGNGAYSAVYPSGRYTLVGGINPNPPELLVQLEITSASGRQTISTDGTWSAALGPTLTSNWWGGEDYDARAEPAEWAQAQVMAAPFPSASLTWRGAPAVRVMESVKPVAITQPLPGTYVFDLGLNFSGWFQLQVAGPAGALVTMRIGEILNSDGTVSQATTGSPIFDTYTLSGKGVETWHPKFAYHGFRYVQVTGLPAPPTSDTITGFVLRGANDPAGSFSSSNALLNQIHTIINRAIQSNMMAIFTDCPDREKRGWLGDTEVMLGSITRNYDVAAYLRNVTRNMNDSQDANGLIPTFVPTFFSLPGIFGDDPNWGNAIVLIPWCLYQAYGDVGTLKTYYPNMQRYLEYLTAEATGNIIPNGLGDWETPVNVTPSQAIPPSMTSTYGYYRTAQTLSQIAAVLGYGDEAMRYSGLAASIGTAFNAAFLDATNHTYGQGQQAADALALDMDIVPPDQRQPVLNHLKDSIRSSGNHAEVGIVGLQALVRVLSAAGLDDVIYEIATQTTYPSYGYEVVNGVTSLAETWELDPTSSFNHMMFGSLDEWFTSGLAGIRQAPGSIGYERLVIRPAIMDDLTEVDGSYQTPNGVAASNWFKDSQGVVHLSVTIPGNTTAAIWVPVAVPSAGNEGAKVFHPGLRSFTVYNVGPGAYNFEISAARHPGAR
jgi:alpha-L-rhamnosidase